MDTKLHSPRVLHCSKNKNASSKSVTELGYKLLKRPYITRELDELSFENIQANEIRSTVDDLCLDSDTDYVQDNVPLESQDNIPDQSDVTFEDEPLGKKSQNNFRRKQYLRRNAERETKMDTYQICFFVLLLSVFAILFYFIIELLNLVRQEKEFLCQKLEKNERTIETLALKLLETSQLLSEYSSKLYEVQNRSVKYSNNEQ